jgi:hypothetical protein
MIVADRAHLETYLHQQVRSGSPLQRWKASCWPLRVPSRVRIVPLVLPEKWMRSHFERAQAVAIREKEERLLHVHFRTLANLSTYLCASSFGRCGTRYQNPQFIPRVVVPLSQR